VAVRYVEVMIVLRDVRDSDLDTFFEHWTDEQARQMAAFMPADAHERAAFDARWEKHRSDPAILLKTIELDGEAVGSISSFDNEQKREVTYWIGRAHWGKGIATRALQLLLDRETARPLHAAAAADNTGSLRVLEKCGFRVVGEARGFANARGQEVDEVILRLDSAQVAPRAGAGMSSDA
jgi:RimJ/RimL family protein N-acetyltransferase